MFSLRFILQSMMKPTDSGIIVDRRLSGQLRLRYVPPGVLDRTGQSRLVLMRKGAYPSPVEVRTIRRTLTEIYGCLSVDQKKVAPTVRRGQPDDYLYRVELRFCRP